MASFVGQWVGFELQILKPLFSNRFTGQIMGLNVVRFFSRSD